jgi:hypothetical protein
MNSLNFHQFLDTHPQKVLGVGESSGLRAGFLAGRMFGRLGAVAGEQFVSVLVWGIV